MKICSKRGCIEIGVRNVGQLSYCNRCYRWRHMIDKAQKRKKYRPNSEELDVLLFKLGDEMRCPNCKIKMVWHGKKNKKSNIISLQHNNNGSIQFLCFSCNVGHGNSKLGDEYFNLKNNEKYCPKCNQTLNKKDFYKNKSRKDGLCNLCKTCDRLRSNKQSKIIEVGKCL